ncbi:MAG: PCP reductase family protein [Chloroflexi bacterium]|nr:PCP reductase family protein [Chloroflexota bacterium]
MSKPAENSPTWTPEAEARLMQVPEGIMRELTRQRVEGLARQSGQTLVTLDLVEQKYRQWLIKGSAEADNTMTWTTEAQERIERIPSFVRGMVVKAIEAYVTKQGLRVVSSEIVDEAKRFWAETERFHEP